MTTQELTGYVRAIVDRIRIYEYIDEEKCIEISIEQLRNEWLIKAQFIGEIKMVAVHDPDGRGITCYDPVHIPNDDYFFWKESEGVSKLHKEVEEMIDRINKIEL